MGSAIGEPVTPPVPTRRDFIRVAPVATLLMRLRAQGLADGAVMLCPDDFCDGAVEIYGLKVIRMPSLAEPMIGLPG